jgi:hypothetical protein
MKLGTSRRGTLLPALVAFLVLATIGAALAGTGTFASRPNVDVTVSDPPRTGHRDAGRPGGETGPSSGETGTDDITDDGDDVAATCARAIEEGETALERAHGLDRAIEAIVANCARGHTQGLLNALARLQANQDRRAEREHGADPNEHASDGANGPGGKADPKGAEPKDHGGRPEEPGRSAGHASASASSHGASSH